MSRPVAAALLTGLGAMVVVAVAAVATGPPKGVAAPAANCRTVPAKMWGGVWHYSPSILHPTRLETACVSYPATGKIRTLIKVTVTAVP